MISSHEYLSPETETEQEQESTNGAEEEAVAKSDACLTTRTAMPMARLKSFFFFSSAMTGN
jgi:hypothetical protein